MIIKFSLFDLKHAWGIAYSWKGKRGMIARGRMPSLWRWFLDWRYKRKLTNTDKLRFFNMEDEIKRHGA